MAQDPNPHDYTRDEDQDRIGAGPGASDSSSGGGAGAGIPGGGTDMRSPGLIPDSDPKADRKRIFPDHPGEASSPAEDEEEKWMREE